MQKKLFLLKPAASRKVHLLSAAFLWSAIGCTLMIRGCIWLMEKEVLFFFLPALVLGTLKSLFILDKSAKKSIDRIQQFTDGTCLGAVYSIKTWALVLAMMFIGHMLRHSGISLILLGVLYVTIGWTLCFSSRHAWETWWNLK